MWKTQIVYTLDSISRKNVFATFIEKKYFHKQKFFVFKIWSLANVGQLGAYIQSVLYCRSLFLTFRTTFTSKTQTWSFSKVLDFHRAKLQVLEVWRQYYFYIFFICQSLFILASTILQIPKLFKKNCKLFNHDERIFQVYFDV